jgi:hypothetical protein
MGNNGRMRERLIIMKGKEDIIRRRKKKKKSCNIRMLQGRLH